MTIEFLYCVPIVPFQFRDEALGLYYTPAVLFIAKNRVTQPGCMNADLGSTACFWKKSHLSHMAKLLYQLKLGCGRFPLVLDRKHSGILAFARVARMSA